MRSRNHRDRPGGRTKFHLPHKELLPWATCLLGHAKISGMDLRAALLEGLLAEATGAIGLTDEERPGEAAIQAN